MLRKRRIDRGDLEVAEKAKTEKILKVKSE
jgi:hypothetical protein